MMLNQAAKHLHKIQLQIFRHHHISAKPCAITPQTEWGHDPESHTKII